MVEFDEKPEIFCYEDPKDLSGTTSSLSDCGEADESFSYPIKELFNDGKRRIDFILVYQKGTQVEVEVNLDQIELEQMDKFENGIDKSSRREYFLEELASVGLEMEEETLEVSRIGDKRFGKLRKLMNKNSKEKEKIEMHFIKLHAPFYILCKYAEKLNYAMPYEDPDALDEFPEYQFKQNLNKTLIEKLGFNFLIPKIPSYLEQSKYRTKVFVNKNQDKYHGIENEDMFFSSGQRCGIVEYILKTASYGHDPYGLKTGIDKLIKKKLFTDAYPLHEGSENQEKEDFGKPLTERQFLKLNWASFKPRAFFKTQPIPQIRHYLGEKVAIYFAWLGLYTKWLHFSTLIGLIIFTLGPYTLGFNIIANEVSKSTGDSLILCPSCSHRCDFQALHESQFLVKISSILDNEGTVLYAAFMSFWAILFLEFWKRYQFYLQYEWDLLDYEPLEESPRPEFVTAMRNRYKNARNESYKKQIWKVNPITGKTEFFQEATQIKLKILAGLSVTLTLVLAVIAILVGIIFYRAGIAPIIGLALLQISVHDNPTLAAICSLAGAMVISLTAGILQLIFIFVMNAIYRRLAIVLTRWELNRTQSEHDDSFTVKMALFQIVNFYASPMYIAFIKGRILVAYPGRDLILPGITGLEHCAQYGCLLELTFQLIVVFALKQTINNIKELGIPLVKIGIRKFASLLKKEKEQNNVCQPPWQRDLKLEPGEAMGMFEEYLELVIQFGFVTIFATAFPLAPLLALINNYFEIRLDAIKYLRLTRRQVPERVQDIGPWYSLLDGIAKFAVITNSLLIPFLGSTVNLWAYRATYPGQEHYLNTTLVTVPIRDFIYTNQFPDYRSRTLQIIEEDHEMVSFDDLILLPSTFYCKDGGGSNCTEVRVTGDNMSSNNCCEFLGLMENSTVPSECTATNGTRFCCIDGERNNTEYLDTQTYKGDKNASDCCDIVVERFFTNRTGSEDSRTLYYRDGGAIQDPSNPQYGGRFFSGCNVKFVSSSAACRFDSGYEIIEYMTEEQREFFYKTMLYKILFAVTFEHFVFLIVAVVAYIIPDIPETIQNQIKRDKYISKYGNKSKGVRKSKPSIFERGQNRKELQEKLRKISATN